jgi:hypothetical protein
MKHRLRSRFITSHVYNEDWPTLLDLWRKEKIVEAVLEEFKLPKPTSLSLEAVGGKHTTAIKQRIAEEYKKAGIPV